MGQNKLNSFWMRFPGAADDYFVTVNQVHFLLTSLNVISAFREFKEKEHLTLQYQIYF